MIMYQEQACTSATGQGLQRTRYFGHQLVGAEDLTEDQNYFREKHRRHNRHLHGWGVVCGTCVRRGEGSCEVVIEPGYILGPYGDEIVVEQPYRIDLCTMESPCECGCCGDTHADPWCGDDRANCSPGVKYLAIKYEECLSRPVRKLSGACGGGCDEDCEHSRIREGFKVQLLDALPPGYTTPLTPPSLVGLLPCYHGVSRPCPPCPESPWVVLADITIGSDCSVIGVDCFRHRRYVVTWAPYFMVCGNRKYSTAARAPSGDEALFARFMAAGTGDSNIADLSPDAAGNQPRAMVVLSRHDGSSTTLPGFFEVQPGDTMGSLLSREGAREFFDPVSGETFTLRHLASAAGIDPSESVSTTSAALAAFEGLRVDLPALRGAHEVLAEVLSQGGATRLGLDGGGALDRASALAASDLRGVGTQSFVGKKLAGMTVGEIAAKDADAFIGEVAKGSPKAKLEANRKKAKEVWSAARRVVDATSRVSTKGER